MKKYINKDELKNRLLSVKHSYRLNCSSYKDIIEKVYDKISENICIVFNGIESIDLEDIRLYVKNLNYKNIIIDFLFDEFKYTKKIIEFINECSGILFIELCNKLCNRECENLYEIAILVIYDVISKDINIDPDIVINYIRE